MKPIKFFIIIPIYNVESYLHKCLDSIVSQTYKNFEVICVNDGSTDKSLEIAKSYADSDSRFTLTSQANQGQSVARNKALDIAKQKWLESSQEEQEQIRRCGRRIRQHARHYHPARPDGKHLRRHPRGKRD